MMLNVTADDIFNISADNISSAMESGENRYIPYAERPETYIVPVIFSLILLVGVVGNGVLILILLCDADMRNVPNTYVLSLAIGDLLAIMTCVPFTSVIYTFESWPWSENVCKISEFAKDISIGVAVFTLAALSVERYYAIMNPFRRYMAGLNAKPFTILMAILIWVLAIVLAMPSVLFSYIRYIPLKNFTISVCTPFPEEFGMAYAKSIIIFKFLAYYLIPLCMIVSFYLGTAWHLVMSIKNMPGELSVRKYYSDQINARRRVGKMIICFAFVFAICFLPYHVYMMWFHFWRTTQRDFNQFWHIFRIISFCLSFSNSCVNPIALYLISRTFRQKFNRYLRCINQRENNTIHDTISRHTVQESSRDRRHTQEVCLRNFNECTSTKIDEVNSTKFEIDSTKSKPNIIETCL